MERKKSLGRKAGLLFLCLLACMTCQGTAAEAEETEFDLHGKTILAAEDNELNAEILKVMLESEGANVTLVENGVQEVEAFEQSEVGTYDYILTDIMMPEMDGYTAGRTIRSLDRADAGNVIIIALTANAFAEDTKKALDAGMDAHLAKPFTVQQLKVCLRELENRK